MDKWKTILTSSRFQAAVANILFIILNDKLKLGLPIEAVAAITTLVIAFIIGRTLKEDRPANNSSSKPPCSEGGAEKPPAGP